VQALYACLPERCPALGRGPLGATSEPTYRLYHCERCAVQVRICQRCDHGNVYCAGECARIRRRESLRRAQARYQRSRPGARRHAARQRRWRARRREAAQIVTHQGSPVAGRSGIVAASPLLQSAPADASPSDPEPRRDIPRPLDHCAFCGGALPAWTRLRLWRWSG
jgi:hypothetical protein